MEKDNGKKILLFRLRFEHGNRPDACALPRSAAGLRARLEGYRLAERLYADIETAEGCAVKGVLWSVTLSDLRALDRFEGVAAGAYKRGVYAFSTPWGGGRAYAYEMTPQTRLERTGRAFPRWYRDICLHGALQHGMDREFFRKEIKGA